MVIFVCHGNVNRSKMAEAIYNHYFDDKCESRAVGIKAIEGKLTTKKTRDILERNGFTDYNNRSKILTKEDIEKAEVIYVMDHNNIKHYKERFGDFHIEKLKLLPSFIGKTKIKDPAFSKGVEEYEKCFQDIKQCILIMKEKDAQK